MEGESSVTRIERAVVTVPGVGEVPVPAVVAASGPELANRFLEFFLVAIRNPNTRRAYAAAVRAFCAWLQCHGARDLAAVERFCQISRHFQAVIPDVEPINGQNHNISYCRGTLARKLTELRKELGRVAA